MRARRRPLAGCLSALLCGVLLAAVLPGAAAGAPPPCASLAITHFAVSPTQPFEGQPATVAIEVKNSGTCAAASFVVQFKLSQHSSAAVAEETSPPLNPGESESLTLPYDFPTAGNFQTEVVIDPAKEVPQASYVKDIAIKPVTVIALAANLVIKSITVTSNDPTNAVVENRPALAVVVVENTGNAPAAPFYVQWTPYSFAKALTQPASGGLEPGHSETVDIEYTYPIKGAVVATFAINASGRLTPFTSKTKEYTVQAPLPNLRIVGVTQHPEFAGLASSVEVTIENNGNAAAGHFLAQWVPGKGKPALTQEVNGVAEGATTTITFTNVFQPAGTYEGTVTLDPSHSIKELFSTEKTAKTHLVIPEPTVDLTVTGVSVSKPVIQAQPATVLVTVKNLGNTASPSFVTAWNPDSLGVSGSGSQTVAKETGPLGPGEERPIKYEFTYPKAGLYRSVAEVNPGRVITETNYADNVALEEVTVEAAGIKLEFSPAPPAQGIHFASPEFNGSRMFVNEKGTATLTVINKGPIATGPFEVQFQQESATKAIAGSKEGLKQAKFLPGLNPNEHTELTFNVSYSKRGHYLTKAVIDPAGRVTKTIPEDIDTQEIEVKGKTAKITVSAKELKIKYRPGNVPTPTTGLPKPLKGNFTIAKQHFENWTAVLFVYAPGKKCKVQSSNLSGETITKTVNDLAPEEGGGGFCPREVQWKPTEPEQEPGRATTKLHTKVELEEEQPLVAVTQPTSVFEREVKISIRICFLFICKTKTLAEIPVLEFASPGLATIHETRPEYINLKSSPAKTVEVQGTGCKDDTGNEEPEGLDGGHCFDALYELSGEHTGPAVVRAHALSRAVRARADAGAEGEEGGSGEGETTEEKEAAEREAEEKEAAEQEAIENELAEGEEEAVLVAEREAAEAEASERANATAAIEEGFKGLEEVNRHLEQESKAAVRRAINEALEEAEQQEGSGASVKAVVRTKRVTR